MVKRPGLEENGAGVIAGVTLERIMRLRPSSMAHPDSLAAVLRLLLKTWKTSLELWADKRCQPGQVYAAVRSAIRFTAV